LKLCRFDKERGISLIETIVGLAIVSIISLAFLSGLGTSFKSQAVQGKNAVGEAIATSQMEYIKTQPFSDNEWIYTVSSSNRSSTQPPSWWDEYNPVLLDTDYERYYAESSAQDFDFDRDSTVEVPGDDDSIRKITVNVYNYHDEFLFTLTAYKTNR
jgi:type II secretory pathway pseudopilin PulG